MNIILLIVALTLWVVCFPSAYAPLAQSPFDIPEDRSFQVILNPHWSLLTHVPACAQLSEELWILAGTITFKKKAPEAASLSELNLFWHGHPLSSFNASLYKPNAEKQFIPISANLLADSTWNPTKQMLKFKFNKPQTLGPVTTLYLVITIPAALDTHVRQGRFEIDRNSLPHFFKERVPAHTLSLALGQTPSTATLTLTTTSTL